MVRMDLRRQRAHYDVTVMAKVFRNSHHGWELSQRLVCIIYVVCADAVSHKMEHIGLANGLVSWGNIHQQMCFASFFNDHITISWLIHVVRSSIFKLLNWQRSKRMAQGQWSNIKLYVQTQWRHRMETFSALLAICEGIHRSPVDSPHTRQWRGALIFCLICDWTNGWANNRDTGDYDVTAMKQTPTNNDQTRTACINLCKYLWNWETN